MSSSALTMTWAAPVQCTVRQAWKWRHFGSEADIWHHLRDVGFVPIFDMARFGGRLSTDL